MSYQLYILDSVIAFNDLDATDDTQVTMTIQEFIDNNKEDFEDATFMSFFIKTLFEEHVFNYALMLDTLEIRLVSIAYLNTVTNEVFNFSKL